MDFERVLAERPELLAAIAEGGADRQPLPILSAKVKLLWNCNLACRFCSLPAPEARMEREAARHLARGLHACGLRKVHFSGGEIFLHPDIFAILEDWSSLGIQVNLTTNATLLGKDDVRRLEETGVHGITISLDSAEPRIHDKIRGMKGAHKAAWEVARRVAARGKLRLGINTVVTAATLAGIPAMRQRVRELGVRVRWKLIPVDAERKNLRPSAEELARLAAEVAAWPELEDRYPFGKAATGYSACARGRHGFRRGRCFVPWFHLFVSPDGSCYPCCMSRGKTPPLGNILTEGVTGVLTSPILGAVRKGTALATSPDGGDAFHSRPFPVCSRCDDFLRENEAVERLLAGRKP